MIDSIWTRTARLPRFKGLEGDLKTDVLVIGGGITGLLCAWMLKRAGADCAVVEAGRICGGTTGGTTGKITAQHGLITGGCSGNSARKPPGSTGRLRRRPWSGIGHCAGNRLRF